MGPSSSPRTLWTSVRTCANPVVDVAVESSDLTLDRTKVPVDLLVGTCQVGHPDFESIRHHPGSPTSIISSPNRPRRVIPTLLLAPHLDRYRASSCDPDPDRTPESRHSLSLAGKYANLNFTVAPAPRAVTARRQPPGRPALGSHESRATGRYHARRGRVCGQPRARGAGPRPCGTGRGGRTASGSPSGR